MHTLTDEQRYQFEQYLQELKIWNEKVNLTAIIEEQDIIKKHFEDSLTVLRALPASAKKLIDIGTGAGFPGIPLKIVRPELEVTLVETVGKKVQFLQHIIEKLELTGIHAVHGRAEDLGQNATYREHFDVVTARAVARLNILCEYALPFLSIGGMFISQKVKNTDEIEEAAHAVEILGGSIKEIKDVELADIEPRQLILIEKIRLTPPIYPRKAGLPSKKPLL